MSHYAPLTVRLYKVRDLIALLFQYTIKLIKSTCLSKLLQPALYIACVGRSLFFSTFKVSIFIKSQILLLQTVR